MMRKLLGAVGVSSLLMAASLSAASAADMALKAPPPPPPPAVSWTGCYIDGGVGYGIWNQNHSTTYPNGTTSIDSTDGGNGWLGRFGGGCDYQFGVAGLGNLVIGAFGDYDVMDLKGSMSPLESSGGFPIVTNETEQGAWYGGGRIGYLITPSVLTYFDGGWTQTRFDSMDFTNNFGVPVDRMIPAHTYQGWFLGGGYEYALNFSWLPITGLFWRTEYRYSEYQRDDLPEFLISTGAPFGSVVHADKQVQTVTSSLVWRFNFGGPIATRY